MVIATLEDRKGQTRRVITNKWLVDVLDFLDGPGVQLDYVIDQERIADNGNKYNYTGWLVSSAEYPEEGSIEIKCPYGKVGDRLWVRETFNLDCEVRKHRDCPCGVDNCLSLSYKATHPEDVVSQIKWSPSIHMPRWASRITLEITDVRVERVQDISYSDFLKEGLGPVPCMDDNPTNKQIRQIGLDAEWIPLWDSINKKRGYGWDINPWVWVITFKKELK